MICFLSDIKIYDRIDIPGYHHEVFTNRHGNYLEVLLKKSGFQLSRQIASDDLQELKGDVIITLGDRATGMLLVFPKSQRLSDYAGKEYAKDDKIIVPWYSLNYLLNRGKSLEQETIQLFSSIKEKYGNTKLV